MKIKFLFGFLALAFVVLSSNVANAQEDKSKRVSPPKQATASIGDLNIVIDYSAPSVKGREIWGALVPYGKIWRTGANEATTFEVNQDVLIEGEELAAGKYSLFTLPSEDKITFILNKIFDQWGAYSYDESQDVLRVDVTPTTTEEHQEMLMFDISSEDKKGLVSFKWGNLSAGFTVAPKTAN